MLVVLDAGATRAQIDAVLSELERLGLRGELMDGLEKPLVHVVDGPGREARKLLSHEGVQALIQTSGPRIRTKGRYFFPYHLLNWSSVALLVLGLLVLVAGFDPPGVGFEVDPYGPEPEVQIPWYLRAPIALLARGLPGFLAFGALVAFLVLLPILDRTRPSSPASSAARLPLVLAAFVFVSACLLVPLLF